MAWSVASFPGLAIFFSGLCFNLLDVFRDVVDAQGKQVSFG